MSKFSPLDFQQEAIDKLVANFIHLWGNPEPQRPLVFKSPTGSGKTFMVANFVHNLNGMPNWDYDKAFIWITFSEDLAMQSKDKFQKYFDKNLENSLLTVNDFKQGKLHKNDILFINWQKLVASKKANRLLRRPDEEAFLKEQGYYFEDLIENTHKEKREFILIVDESHKNRNTSLAQEIIDIINPKVIINVSATPKNIPGIDQIDEGIAGYVGVKREKVVEEGLIKEKIAVQTEEDLAKYPNKDLDELLLDLAIKRQKELKEEYKILDKDINPLVLIQLPNDDSRLKDAGQKTKEEIVLDYLQKKKIDVDRKVALWFDGKQKNMDFITHNESDIDFMLFKQAAGTGWDCPRAHILVMFREINSASFYVQTIGRILRMAEPNQKDDYKNNPNLRTGYLYTNYRRNDVEIPDQSIKNKPFIYTSKRREGLKNIEGLYSDFVSRVDYGDLGNAVQFQMSFLKSFNNYFAFDEADHPITLREKIQAKGIEINPILTNKLIVNAEFTDYDKINLDFAKKGQEEDYKISRNDVEKLFNWYCFQLLSEQTEVEAKVSNVSRSWSPLKSAFRVWFKSIFDQDSYLYYRILINDLRKEQSSVFRQALTKALKDYYPIKKEFLKNRKKDLEEREAPLFEIMAEYTFTEDYAELTTTEGTSELSAIQPFYLKKKYIGRENELKFLNFLEQKKDKLDWWFKNGDSGKEFYCLKYYNTAKKEEALFYPDWIVKFKDGRVGIFDTKSGNTAQNPEGRAEGLAKKLRELNTNNGNYVGGLVVLENNQWYYFNNEKYLSESAIRGTEEPQTEFRVKFNYNYTPGKLTKNWKPFNELFD
ncbi:DNA/RNA helicase, superfamily II [Saprospira grandis DSM 2844]|uniref:DNA/RNA helicase, superfamily II n=1 Tax=Saprospira grandis DSM 2844 TaxID=694433 RepID=J0P8L9_9BACT|nr:DEAD/DEAH box helicase family protein [Saprospira grandis]EJF53907.1 DNA/RNA helicase, superfamily II [Saprospira grandis DSM 2844]